jgi:hypothetical protein
MSPTRTHLKTIVVTDLPAKIAGCTDCLASGGSWLQLVDEVEFVIAPP